MAKPNATSMLSLPDETTNLVREYRGLQRFTQKYFHGPFCDFAAYILAARLLSSLQRLIGDAWVFLISPFITTLQGKRESPGMDDARIWGGLFHISAASQ